MLGLGLVAIALAVIAPSLDAKENVALVLGLVGCSVILAHPFVGLFVLVFLIQLGGLVNSVAGNAGEFVLEGLAAVTFAGVVLQAPRRPRSYRWGTNPVTFRIAVLFVCSALLSAMFAEFSDEARIGVLRLTSLLLLFYLVIVMAHTKERVTWLVLAILASTALSGAGAALGYLGIADLGGTAQAGGRQMGASSSVATTAGNMFLPGTLMAGLLALRIPRWRAVGAATFLMGAGGIVFSMARSALLVFVFALGWLGIKMRHSRHLPSIAVLVIIGAVAVVPFLPEKVWERFDELQNPSADWTLGRRWGYHVIGLDLLSKNPVVGVGPSNYGQHYVDYEYRWVEGRLLETRSLHNTYLSIAVEFGLVGFTIFAALILSVMRGLQRVRKHSRDPTLVHLAEVIQYGLAALLIAIVTIPAIGSKLLWTLFALATAVYSLAEQQAKSAEPTEGDTAT